LAHLALHDPLTDLPNRAQFQEHLAVAVANAERHQSGGAVLSVDLNDGRSHRSGRSWVTWSSRADADEQRSVGVE
jgi:predicted signal transduction protein with EAL and GGDEF domain